MDFNSPIPRSQLLKPIDPETREIEDTLDTFIDPEVSELIDTITSQPKKDRRGRPRKTEEEKLATKKARERARRREKAGKPKKEYIQLTERKKRPKRKPSAQNMKGLLAHVPEALSDDDREFIGANAGTLSTQEIADELGKRKSTVYRYMENRGLLGNKDKRDIDLKRKILNELHEYSFWEILCTAYTERELFFFEEEWYDFVIQLDDNITATERLSLRQLIETQIRIDRLSIHEQKVNSEIAKLDESIKDLQDELWELKDEDEDNEDIFRIQQEIQTLLGNQGALATNKISIARDIDSLMKAQSKVMSDLDVTRAKRVEKYDISDKTWAKMLLEIKENPRLKRQMGAMAYISLLATERMREMLRRPFVYADGDEHSPIMGSQEIDNHELAELVETLYVPKIEENNDKTTD